MKLDDWKRRVEELLGLGEAVRRTETVSYQIRYVDTQAFSGFRSAALSFLRNTYGQQHPYYTDFDHRVRNTYPESVESGIGILKGVQNEMAGGWLRTTKGLVSAEIFSDFLEMADYLLSEGYKDAAAVMVGSVLEEHLRQLCGEAGIAVSANRDGKDMPKKADALNAELAKAQVYNKIDQKQVTAWLGLRNDAAHGHYGEYDIEQVRAMLSGVMNFMARVSV
jgi:hypothetical protein